MSVPRRIAALLELAAQDTDAARTLAATSNRYAAYHCQQAVEKILKAVLLRRTIESGAEHRLDVLVALLPDGDAWKDRLRPFEEWSPYATTFRYPTPGGRIVAAPDAAKVTGAVNDLDALIRLARDELR
jgi:HEPN domain-containing protein